MHKSNEKHKDIIWDRKNILLFKSKDRKLQPLYANAPRTWSGLLLMLLQVHYPNDFSHNQLITSGEGNGLYMRKG
jgi:hypothetical protein